MAIEHFDLVNLEARLKLLRWLIKRSDSAELTHGEKHYYHMVALDTCNGALADLGAQFAATLRTDVIQPRDAMGDDIPF